MANDLQTALRTIAEYPVTDLSNLDAVNMRHIAQAALTAPVATEQAQAVAPCDGDYLRWAAKQGAKVDWNGNGGGVHFTAGDWGRFCDVLRATPVAASPEAAPAAMEGVATTRPCYMCGRPDTEHPWQPRRGGGMERGPCPATQQRTCIGAATPAAPGAASVNATIVYAQLSDEARRRTSRENIDDVLAALAQPAPVQAGALRKGYVAVPMRLTRAMQEVLEQESWEWADLLMMAEATTEEEDEAIRRFESLDLLEKAEREAAEQQGAWPTMHPTTVDLVQRFSQALAEKLATAEKKYGYSDGWLLPDWMDECRKKLIDHIAKGDPRDVAAYCAFLWHHGEKTFVPTKADPYEALMNEVMACGGEVTPREIIFNHATFDVFMQSRKEKTALEFFADEVEAALCVGCVRATDEMFAEFSAIDNSLSVEDMRKIIERILAIAAPVQQDAPAPSMVGDAKGGAA